MKLKIQRRIDERGILRKRPNYVVRFKLILGPEERELVRKHQLEEFGIISIRQDDGKTVEVDVETLLEQFTFDAVEAWMSLNFEQDMKTACQEFNRYLDQLKDYTGTVEVDLTGEGAPESD